MNRRIAIIDLDSVAYVIGNPNKQLDKDGNPLRTEDGRKFLYIDKTEEELKDSADYIMELILNSGNFTHWLGYIKGKNTIASKLLIDPLYKQDRHFEQPKWWNFVKNDLIERWSAIPVNDMETDDMVNIVRLSKFDSDDNVTMVCIDSDLLGLEGVHFNWKNNKFTGEWTTTTKEQAYYNFWSSIICGTHNNTKGIPKKGEKFVEKLFSTTKLSFRSAVLNEFIKHFGRENGKIEFYKNYKMCKILDKIEGFVIPTPIKYVKIQKENNKFEIDF